MNKYKDLSLEKTKDAAAQLDALMDAAVDAIVLIDMHGRIELFNKAAEMIFGYKEDEVLGQNVNMLMPSPFREQHDGYIRRYLSEGNAKIIGIGRRVTAIKKDGSQFPIHLSVGQVVGSSHLQFVGFIRDISLQVQSEQEASEHRERLSHVTRLSSMGELAAGLAHEINQPLTAVTAYAQASRRLIELGINDPDRLDMNKLLSTMDKIHRQAQRASDVIQRLRQFVKKRDSNREKADLNNLIEDTVNLAKADTRLLDHGIKLRLASEENPVVHVDPVQIQQVLLNLIRNAIDAMESHGGQPVEIVSRMVDTQTAEVQVIDLGEGVPEDKRGSLFEPFVTTKSDGMGMGLPISQSIIHAHGGRLYYRSADRGSVFSFTLPIHLIDNEETQA